MFQKISDSKNECPGGIAQFGLGGNARIGQWMARALSARALSVVQPATQLAITL